MYYIVCVYGIGFFCCKNKTLALGFELMSQIYRLAPQNWSLAVNLSNPGVAVSDLGHTSTKLKQVLKSNSKHLFCYSQKNVQIYFELQSLSKLLLCVNGSHWWKKLRALGNRTSVPREKITTKIPQVHRKVRRRALYCCAIVDFSFVARKFSQVFTYSETTTFLFWQWRIFWNLTRRQLGSINPASREIFQSPVFHSSQFDHFTTVINLGPDDRRTHSRTDLVLAKPKWVMENRRRLREVHRS